MTAADHLAKARSALTPRDGQGSRVTAEQAAEATAHAEIAKASALDRIATALEALAADTLPAGIDLRPAIGHSV
ncbi:hypothetical protein ACF09I_35585 [Streptomyces sp. NPDC014940]|uniref:hypothetical protein n=1 Tax=Streptomyces sp. NPDC014940 TaxID=3364932 RepID=UPI0037021AC4